MTPIETSNQEPVNAALEHAVRQRWLAPGTGLVARLAQHFGASGAHPARCLVLLPYAQLLPLARQMWAAAQPDGFAPRMETSQTLLRRVAHTAQAHDIRFDPAHDLLTARDLLEQAGQGAHADTLVGGLLESAQSLASVVMSQPEAQRQAWGRQARAALEQNSAPWLGLEQVSARLALEWALASSYPSDQLATLLQPWDAVAVLQGYQPDPGLQAALAALPQAALVLPLAADDATTGGQVALHECTDPEDEAQRAAACVLQHLQAGRTPVALAATDRVLTRRIRAMLDQQGVALRDETGWKLSTTRSAAQFMTLLRACRWDASSDQVIDWLKNLAPEQVPGLDALEHALRRQGVARWALVESAERLTALHPQDVQWDAVQALVQRVAAQRHGLAKARAFAQWRSDLTQALTDWGLLAALQSDAAGQRVLQALHLGDQASAAWAAEHGARRLSLAEFSTWVDGVLEATSYVPPAASGAQVVVLPVAQLLARPFAALVWPGCDEQRLAASPEPPGVWTAAQRLALGLPSRDSLAHITRASWAQALCTPHCDLLWRRQDELGEPVLPSPLVQRLRHAQACHSGSEPRVPLAVPVQLSPRPSPVGAALPLQQLSASAYDDLRRCPYRFFALRLLGLQDTDELASELDKRDFGLWLHDVLKSFHEQLRADTSLSPQARSQLLDHAAQLARQHAQLDAAEFLPFEAEWPALRDGYQEWLQGHEKTGARFVQAEQRQQQGLGALTLVGKIDRIDHLGDDSVFILDYKTESKDSTRARLKDPYEDMQLAFYAALLPHDSLRAAYVNVDHQLSKTFEQTDVVAVRDALIEGLQHDFERIRQGAALLALGDGSACEYCAARGLCRKDFWPPESQVAA